MAILATVAYYLLFNEFSVPEIVKNKVSELTRFHYGLDFDFNEFKVNFPSNKVNISSFSFSVADKTPFVSIGSTTFHLVASTTKSIGFSSDKVIVDKVYIENLFFDMMSPQLEEASGAFKLPSVPAKEIYLNGAIINTPYGKFDLSSNTASIIKDGSIIDLLLDIPHGPFGINSNFNSEIDLNSGTASIALKLQHENIADFSPLEMYASENNFIIDDGKFNLSLYYFGNIENRINKPLENIAHLLNEEISGNISLKDTKIGWNGLTFDGNLLASKVASESWNYSVNGKIASGSANIKGKWLGSQDKMTKFLSHFSLEDIHFSRERLVSFGLPDFDFSPGSIGFNGVINGDINGFVGSGSTEVKDWYFLGKKLNKALLKWNLLEDYSLLLNGFIDTYLGNVNASSTVWLSGDNKFKGVFDGNLKEIKLKEIGSIFDIPLDGIGKGPFVFEIDFLNPLKSIYSLNASLDNFSIFSFNIKHIDGLISGFGKEWKISNPHAYLSDGGEIIVDGYVDSTTVDAKLRIKDVNINTFGVPQNIASGILRLESTISGSLTMPEVKGSLWGENVVVEGMPLKSFKSEFRIKNGVFVLAPIVVKPIDGSFLDGYVTIDLKNAKILNARVNFQQLCIDLLKAYLPENIASKQFDGVLSGYASYSRRQDLNVTNLLIDGRDLTILGQEIDSIYVEAEALGWQAELKSLFVKAFGGKINLTGQFLNMQKFAGSLEGENIKLERMEFLKEFLPNLEGSIDFQGDIDWNGNKRKGNFNIFGRDIKTNDRELGNFGGEIIIDDEKLEIKNGEFDNLGIKMSGDLMWGARQPYFLKLNLDNVDFSFIPQSHNITLFENGSIVVGGNCVVQGELKTLIPDYITLNLDNLRLKKDDDVIIANKPIDLVFQNGALEIRSLELKYKLGLLAVQGIVSSDKNIAVHIDGDNFSAKALGHLLGIRSFNYDGDIQIDARIFGTIDNVKYGAKTEINNLNIEGNNIPLVQAKIDGDKNKIKIEETFIKLKNSSFNLAGEVLLDNYIPNKLDLNMYIPQSPITDLTEYLPNIIKTADGDITGKLIISGNPINPKITGDLHLNGKKIQLASMKKPFTNVVFDMTTDDMVTTINTLNASMGKGVINGYGNVDFKNALGKLDIHIRTEKLDLPFLSLEINNASASLDLTGDIYNPVIDSSIYIPRGKLGLNSSLIPESSTSKPIFHSLKYNFDIEVPRNFWVKNPFLNAEIKGKCSVSGDLDNFKIDGGINTIQGKIFFKQRQFKIQNGEVKFGGVDNSLDPYIFVKSEGQVQSTKIYLTLQGNISNFKPKVYSTPPMSEGDIIAMLTLGRDLNSVSNSNTKELFEDEVLDGLKNSYISALIGDSLSSALNLDELYLTSAFDKKTGKSQSYVRIGKYLSDKFFMAYEGTMSDDKDESYIFEYRLPKGFVFSIEFEQPENNQNYGIRYDWNF